MTPRRSAATAAAALLLVALLTVPGGRSVAQASDRIDSSTLRPSIVWKPIPFGARRRQQMGAYSKRHYGTWRWRLTDPKAIVEHFTDGDTFIGAWSTFASNARHLGELPGTCAHFVIDTDGTIYQLVSLEIRCRHVIGINDTAIGIEHVGRSDASILHNPKMMRASMRLTLWLVAKLGIEVRNVIGHNESLMSPLHHELYDAWRCMTHADWNHRDMQAYRMLLRRKARMAGIPIGPAPAWVDPDC